MENNTINALHVRRTRIAIFSIVMTYVTLNVMYAQPFISTDAQISGITNPSIKISAK